MTDSIELHKPIITFYIMQLYDFLFYWIPIETALLFMLNTKEFLGLGDEDFTQRMACHCINLALICSIQIAYIFI